MFITSKVHWPQSAWHTRRKSYSNLEWMAFNEIFFPMKLKSFREKRKILFHLFAQLCTLQQHETRLPSDDIEKHFWFIINLNRECESEIGFSQPQFIMFLFFLLSSPGCILICKALRTSKLSWQEISIFLRKLSWTVTFAMEGEKLWIAKHDSP